MGYFIPVFFEDLFGLDIHEAHTTSRNRQVDAKELVENIHVYFEVNPPVITDENLVYDNGVEIGGGHNLKNLNQFYFPRYRTIASCGKL